MAASTKWLDKVMNLIVNFNIDLINKVAVAYLFFSFVVFCILAFGTTAPYGKYGRSGWGFKVNAKLAWFIQELPAFLVPILLIFFTDSPKFSLLPNEILLGLYLVHYFHRAFLYPLVIQGSKPLPLAIFGTAIMLCTVNGYIQSAYLLYHADFGENWHLQPSFYIGISIFIFGLCVNIHSDHLLINLRKPGETGYKIPRGGMFEYVSGANFFGEIVEWFGFAIAGWSLPALAFALLTASSLGPRAYHHHQYYCRKFENYPPERKAVIPFVL